ncbi:MAG: hypothetical protein M5U14_04170 [Acidimicrobiia bacterium]|nr:hypothetical protein [Acidimicrobiia bacterium]
MDTLIAAGPPELRLALELALREEPGFDVIGTVSNGRSLLAVLRGTRCDLVVLESGLPDGPVRDVVEQVRALLPSPRIVVLAEPADEPQVDELSPDATVPKGAPPDRLLDALRLVRTRWRQGRDQAPP